MADVTIKGEGLEFDLEKITIVEYRAFASGGLLNPEDDAVLAKVTGKTVEYFRNLSQPDYRRVIKAFFERASQPLSDPN